MSKKISSFIMIGSVLSIVLCIIVEVKKTDFPSSSILEENLNALCEGDDRHLYWRTKASNLHEIISSWYNPNTQTVQDTIICYIHDVICQNPTELHLNKCTNYPVKGEFYEISDEHTIESDYKCTLEEIE